MRKASHLFGGRGCIRLAALVFVIFGCANAFAASQSEIQYNRDIRPILSENCFRCHGVDKNARKAKLRLDDPAVAVEKKAIVPGKPEESELVTRIFSDDPDEMMPPPESNKKLTQQQKELLKHWIAGGAEYQPHWAYILPKRAEIPHVNNPEWVWTPIDAFILAKLEAQGLKPVKPASKITLIRRASLDLTGLPPTPTEVDDFVRDKSHKSFEKVVDRLLACPHYGERWGRYWLDVARYSDAQLTAEGDRPMPNAFRYRDWVVNALNADMPYDRFLTLQIAGDEVNPGDRDALIATGFGRCGEAS